MRKRIVAILSIFLLLLVSACGSSEQVDGDTSWPNKNIEFIVPYGEGGSVDRFARGLGANWEDVLGHPVVIQNKAGASGLLGARSFLGAEPDGHTLFTGLQPTLSMNIVVQDSDFTLDDFKFINIEQQDYGNIVVNKNSPYQTIEDLIEDVRNRPGEVTMSVAAGAGTALFGYAFIDAFDLDVKVVTFDSGGAQRTDTLGGHSDFAASGAYGDLSIKDEVRVLTVASEEKFPGWDAPPVNDILAKYNIDKKIPPIGDNRFVAVHSSFAENNPEVFNKIVESYKENYESQVYQEYIKSQGAESISRYYGPEESLKLIKELHTVVETYEDLLKGSTQ